MHLVIICSRFICLVWYSRQAFFIFELLVLCYPAHNLLWLLFHFSGFTNIYQTIKRFKHSDGMELMPNGKNWFSSFPQPLFCSYSQHQARQPLPLNYIFRFLFRMCTWAVNYVHKLGLLQVTSLTKISDHHAEMVNTRFN